MAYCPGMCPNGLKKNTKNSVKVTDPRLEPSTSEYKAKFLTPLP
jgi:hypothetical protein